MILSQLIFSNLSTSFFNKDFDSMPDYLIYFSTIGIGFNCGEIFFFGLLNKTNNPLFLNLSDTLYFSSFFTGSTMPFLLSTIGAGIYILKLVKIKIIRISIIFQLLLFQ